MLKFLNVFLIFILATVTHWFFIEVFAPLGINVGVMFAFTLIMSVFLNQGGGYVFAFFCGLFLDFFAASMFGGWALVFIIMLFIFYKIEDKIDFKDIGPQIIITAGLNAVCALLYGLLGKIFTGVFIWQGPGSLIAGCALTGLLLPAAYLIVGRYLLFGKKNENKKLF
jgi:rod shape-determining protein MreD